MPNNKFAGLIVAAGKQNRFEMEVPKALVTYGESTLLKYNIFIMSLYCDKIYVVCSLEDYFLFKSYNNKNVEIIPIFSGLGCGDAALKGLNQIDERNIIMIWGDSIQENTYLYERSLHYYANNSNNINFLMPVIYEIKPYVQIITNENKINKVIYSKYNPELITSGFHDLSLFLYDKEIVKNILNAMKDKYYDYNNMTYDIMSKNELTFLDIFNWDNHIKESMNSSILEFSGVVSKSFNTKEEYESVIA